MRPTSLHRRRWLGALGAGITLPWAGLSLAAPSTRDERFVFVVLRGGLDGLTAVPAPGDPAFVGARGPLADLPAAGLPLTGPFVLHPLLPQLHARYRQGELAVVHATGLPYRERSHFEAQQVLESGGTHPHELATGWLGRALAATGRRGVALTTAVPLALRGPAAVDTWAPSALPEPSPDLVARLASLYQGDALLAPALERARRLRDEPAMGAVEAPARGANRRQAAIALARKAGEFLATDDGPRVAVLELGGWDSHTNQAAPQGALSNNLRILDDSIAALRDAMQASRHGTAWRRGVVLVATEFGRTVAVNGTGGTDHGSGGAAFVLGGAVRGGQVFADWPGLSPKDRHEGRDLRVTTDLRSVLRPVLAQHLGVSRTALDREVLPGSAGLPSLDLLRAATGA